MRRALLLLFVAVLSFIGLGAAPASAAQGCGPGYSLMSVLDALRTVPGADGPAQAADTDGDGKICVRSAGGVGPPFRDA